MAEVHCQSGPGLLALARWKMERHARVLGAIDSPSDLLAAYRDWVARLPQPGS